MNHHDIAEKIKISQQQSGLCGQAQANQAPNAGRSYCGDECASTKQEPLISRLARRKAQAEQESTQLDRVLDILVRHPEFEEFIEVLGSGLV